MCISLKLIFLETNDHVRETFTVSHKETSVGCLMHDAK